MSGHWRHWILNSGKMLGLQMVYLTLGALMYHTMSVENYLALGLACVIVFFSFVFGWFVADE